MDLSFEIVAAAIIGLLVVFIIERVYRMVITNARNIDMQRRKFEVLEDRLAKQSRALLAAMEKENKVKRDQR